VTTHLFWDGRAASLEDQVSGPIENAVEMGSSHREMVAALARIPGYRPYFKEAFGDDQPRGKCGIGTGPNMASICSSIKPDARSATTGVTSPTPSSGTKESDGDGR
jgi:hypothetical protein